MRDSNGLDRAALDAWITREPNDPSEWECERCEGSGVSRCPDCDATGLTHEVLGTSGVWTDAMYPWPCVACHATGFRDCGPCEGEGVIHA